MSAHEIEYFHARADEERKAAADAAKNEAVMVHEQLARLYDALARQLEFPTTLKAA